MSFIGHFNLCSLVSEQMGLQDEVDMLHPEHCPVCDYVDTLSDIQIMYWRKLAVHQAGVQEVIEATVDDFTEYRLRQGMNPYLQDW